MSETYKSNGQYVLEYINLFSKEGNTDNEVVWDLSPHMVEVSLFESITSQTMSGYIAILDTFNANDLLPIYGYERIEISFYTAGNEKNPITFTGYVYKSSGKYRITEHTSGYKLMFCSEAAILSKRTFVQSSFSETPSSVVQRIFKSKLKGRSEKLLTVEPTKGMATYTYGALEPLEAISSISRRAYGTDGSLGYFFYETNQDFRFEALEHMYQRDIVASYSNQQGGVYDDVTQRQAEQFTSYQDIELDEENSFMDRMLDGIHGSNFGHFDLKNKTFSTFHYNKAKYFKKEKSLGDVPDKKFIEDGDDKQSITYKDEEPTLYFNEVKGQMKKIESETFRAKVSVFGDSSLKSGNLIYLTVPNWNTDQENIKTVFQGKVLISSIRHTLKTKQYTQALGVRKDSYQEIT